MKKIIRTLIYLSLVGFLTFGSTACSKKTGCPVNETVHTKTGKDGSFSKKRGNSNLFPKKMRRN